jgi:hypothetical protein
MTGNSFHKLALATLIIICLCSCHRKKGCIDRLARNYDSSAKKEATCFYDGRVVFWVDLTSGGSIASEALDYYLNDQFIKKDSGLVAQSAEPDCTAANTVSLSFDLGTSTSETVRYKIIRHKTNGVACDSSVLLRAGYCVPQQLVLH